MCLVALAVVGLLTWATVSLYDSNESRLLTSRTRELGLVLQEVVPTIQTPIASAAALADATAGNTARFRQFVTPYVGPAKAVRFRVAVVAARNGADRGRRSGSVAGVVARAGGERHGANAAGAGVDGDAGPLGGQ